LPLKERFVYVAEELEAGAARKAGGNSAPGGRLARRKGGKRRFFLWIGGIFVVLAIGLGTAAQIAIDRAEPVLRSRVIDTLATRFDSRVTLGEFHVSVIKGFEAEGTELRLYPRRFVTETPLIAIERFSFRVSWASLLRVPMHVGRVTVDGLAISIPPKEERLPDTAKGEVKSEASAKGNAVTGSVDRTQAANVSAGGTNHPGIKIVADEVVIRNTRLLIGTSKPGKLPLDFEISRVVLEKVGPGQPMKFDATLVNPKPVGEIQSSGYFGPFQQESPGETPVRGSYFFNHANLATFKGIAGTLSSTGKYQGPLNRLTVDGQVSVPDFRLDTGNHPMPLHAVFHSTVDGMTGDTYLQPVDAELGGSRFSVSGAIVKVAGGDGRPHGHNISLDVAMTGARIEDFLKLAVRTDPPVMNGRLRMDAKVVIPPGEGPVTERLRLNGKFEIAGAAFNNEKIQGKVNLLSQTLQWSC
jgi:hypothetical protein